MVGRPGRAIGRGRSVVLGITIAAAVLGVVELTLRLAGFRYDPPDPIVSNIVHGMRGLHRFHPAWFWELRPGAQVENCPGEWINRAGFRGPDRPLTRAPGTLRIVTLGDSSTFGTRMCRHRAYPDVLEREIPGAEVLNFGVIGFTAFQGAKLLAGKAIDYHPDLVIAAFGSINEARPALGDDVDAKFALTSRVPASVALWRERLHPLRLFQAVERVGAAFGTDPTDPAEIARRRLDAMDAIQGNADYAPNQSLASFERSLESIVSTARTHGARVAFVIPPSRQETDRNIPLIAEYAATTRRVAARLGVPCWDVHRAFRALRDSDRTLLLDGVHPNVEGHRVYGKFLGQYVRQLVAADAASAARMDAAH